MRHEWIAAVASGVAWGALALLGPDAVAQSASDEIETLLVSGEQPGPGLWAVRQGDHVLWILGSLQRLPKTMTWRSDEVERRVAQSRAVLFSRPSGVQADVGLFRALALIPSALRAARNPDGGRLGDVVPSAVYDKWRALRDKYLGQDDDIEQWRPVIALNRLQSAAFEKSGLASSASARSIVERAAKKHRVRIEVLPAVERTIHIEDPKRILKEASKMQLPDLACFEQGLDQLEQRITEAKLSANAWATGDIARLRTLQSGDSDASQAESGCEQRMLQAVSDLDGAPGAKRAIDALKEQSEVAARAQEWNWMNAARKALEVNESTFAVLPMNLLLSPDGYIAKLRAAGYEVEEP